MVASTEYDICPIIPPRLSSHLISAILKLCITDSAVPAIPPMVLLLPDIVPALLQYRMSLAIPAIPPDDTQLTIPPQKVRILEPDMVLLLLQPEIRPFADCPTIPVFIL